jgi:hypothetical protein
MALDSTTLSALSRLAAAAPSGPWRYDPAKAMTLTGEEGFVLGTIHSPEAGAFIAAARHAVPELLRENEALTRLVRQHIVQFGVCLACGPVKDGHALRCPALPFLSR